MIPALLYAIGLLIALNVQTMNSPLAGAWLLFHAAACLWMYKPEKKNIVGYSCLAWLITLGISTFIFAPVPNGAATMFTLAAMPSLALSMQREHLRPFLVSTLVVLTLYAVLLIVEIFLPAANTAYVIQVAHRKNSASCWPLLDPNNAAAVINCALIPCFYMMMKDKRWVALVGIFWVALFATASKMGVVCALAGCSILLVRSCRPALPMMIGVWGFVVALFLFFWPYASIDDRLMLWEASAQLFLHPLSGLGLGTFHHYYQFVRTDVSTDRFFAHNDILQVALEMGIPAACVFVYCILAGFRRFGVGSAVIFAVFLHSMMEFQFYVPIVSMLLGLAFAYQNLTYERRGRIIP